MRLFIYALIFLLFSFKKILGQEKIYKSSEIVSLKEIKTAATTDKSIEFERPFNFFAAAGININLGQIYEVSIAPTDLTVQFEELSSLTSKISTGLVWNPFFKPVKKIYKIDSDGDGDGDGVDQIEYDAERRGIAFSLLINILDLSFSSGQINTTNPIDVGFGVGYRKEKFLVLLTCEFTNYRQPRKYFEDAYKGKDLQLILDGSEEPVRTISSDDNSIFVNKLIPSLGFKMAYAFSQGKPN